MLFRPNTIRNISTVFFLYIEFFRSLLGDVFVQCTPLSDPEDVGMMDWSGSDDFKGITGVSGNQFTAGSTVVVVRQIIVIVVFQFQVQMLTR